MSSASFSKRGLVQNPSNENAFYLHVNGVSFSYERLCIKTSLEKEIQGNSEMAHWWAVGKFYHRTCNQTDSKSSILKGVVLVAQTSPPGCCGRWTRTETTVKPDVAAHGPIRFFGPDVSWISPALLVTVDRGIISVLSRLLEDRAHVDARALWPCADDAWTTTYQETSIMGMLDALPLFAAGSCCMLPTEFRRVELMTPRIRRRSRLEWTYGMSQARDPDFAERFLTRSIHSTCKALQAATDAPRDTKRKYRGRVWRS